MHFVDIAVISFSYDLFYSQTFSTLASISFQYK